MGRTEGDRERFGRVLLVTALAGTLLALAAVIGPRLVSSGGGSTGPSPESELHAAASTTAPAATTSTTATAPAPTSTVPQVVTPEDGGAVELQLAGVYAGAFGPPRGGFFAGDAIGWHFRVTNTGGEYLWGVFVYLELYGPVSCSARQLEVGESADCWAETNAVPGANVAEAWVTAWTDTRMVTDRASGRVDTAAG